MRLTADHLVHERRYIYALLKIVSDGAVNWYRTGLVRDVPGCAPGVFASWQDLRAWLTGDHIRVLGWEVWEPSR